MKKLMLSLTVAAILVNPVMAGKVKSFCEYGTGVALVFGAGGALWDHTWGEQAYEWYDCDAKPDVGFLNKNTVGILETTTASAPDPAALAKLIISFDFGGNFSFTAYDDDDPGEIAGQILGDVTGTFVADADAEHAIVDEEAGTITIAFGASLHDGPDALFTVTETTGKFKSIHAIGLWEWYVSGTITLHRVPGLSVQNNIWAALGDSTLILAAEEEIVLAGSYYRSSPTK